MLQLIVHTKDGPAYTILVNGNQAVVQAYTEEWQEVAERVLQGVVQHLQRRQA